MRLKRSLRERWMAVAGVLFLLILTLKNISNYNMIHVCGDEFGYWANAAYWNGVDWSSLMENTLYYSYGYSILLFFITLLPINMSIAYQIAIALNVVMLIAIYRIAAGVIRLWFPETKRVTADFIALITVLYPSVTTYTQLTYCETLIVLLYWLILMSIIQFEKSGKDRYGILVVLLSVAAYVVHQRNLGILCSSILIVGFTVIKGRVRLQKVILFLSGGMLLLALSFWVKDNLSSLQWIESGFSGSNNYSGAVKKVGIIFSLEGIRKLFISVVGKMFYIASSSYFLIYIGFTYGVAVVMRAIKKKRALENLYSITWVSFSFIFSVGIAAVFLVNSERMDILIYGRYSESAAGALVLLGIFTVYTQAVSKKVLFIISAFYGVSLMILTATLDCFQGTELVSLTVTGVYRTMHGCADYVGAMYKVGLLTNLVTLSLLFMCLRKSDRRIVFYIGFLLVGVLWILNADYVIKNTILESQHKYTEKILPIAEQIQESEDVQSVIYVIEDRAVSEKDYADTNLDRLQYLLWDIPIERIEISKLNMDDYDKGTYFILIKYADVYKKFREVYHPKLILETGIMALFQY